MLVGEGWGETASVEFPWEFCGSGGGGGAAEEVVVDDDDDDLSEIHWSIFGILIVDLGAIEFDS